jgi:hypothetical protein
MSDGLWFRATADIPSWSVSSGAVLVFNHGVGGLGLRLQGTDRIRCRSFPAVIQAVVDGALGTLDGPVRPQLTLLRN